MIQLTEFEQKLLETFKLSDRDARRLLRVIQDLSIVVGMDHEEIYDFMRFGVENELEILKTDYNWEHFRIRIQKKLKKSPPL
ncbi:hypothetical protein ND861_07985 [Leptospira sp. 2 VSF19]|uniref:Toxin-antitoxin system, antitoxin component n=1 Tax=Leptospira soteropolitanensis TaxID=2950025 RepID=A0AAW5VJ76_9LEPT|nr:hypothetical protein [Leptospira soteropolitanensis]MCW7492933.1 hypothetical protein [Leptospira soteropolitanensis]MCW7500168.1 hypothetical protein [Leptospira soteropolitanensis]MCW7522419.1 hypothetical protein [Leptospira soteropolitanensis]MCW7526275.1 hypothetical protein [Leptospira soteropolitanensis]MCW7529613.1 hypothetical protein [Leptospira soteropolitanensis]